jgi:hypothetical protein
MNRKTIIEETIDVLDNIEKAEVSPFFKSKLNILLYKQNVEHESYMVKPIFIVAFATILLLFNIVLFSKATKSISSVDISISKNSNQQNTQDYFINNSSNYYYDDNQ